MLLTFHKSPYSRGDRRASCAMAALAVSMHLVKASR